MNEERITTIPRTYTEVREELKKLDLLQYIYAEIVICVNASLQDEVSDYEFNLLCSAVKKVWDKADMGYTQRIADIVVDLYQDCGYGFRDENYYETFHWTNPITKIPRAFTLNDLENFNAVHREMVLDLLCDDLDNR